MKNFDEEVNRKVKEVYDIIEKISYPPMIELFARNTRTLMNL